MLPRKGLSNFLESMNFCHVDLVWLLSYWANTHVLTEVLGQVFLYKIPDPPSVQMRVVLGPSCPPIGACRPMTTCVLAWDHLFAIC